MPSSVVVLPTRHIPQLHLLSGDPDAISSHLRKRHTFTYENVPQVSLDTPTRHIPQLHRLSKDPDASFVPSGENDTPSLIRMPLERTKFDPLITSHSFTVLS